MNSRFFTIGTIVSDVETKQFKTAKGTSSSKSFVLEEDRCYGRKVACQYNIEFIGNLAQEIPDKVFSLKGCRAVIVGHLWGSSFPSKDDPSKTVRNLMLRGDRFLLLSTPDMKLPNEDKPSVSNLTDAEIKEEDLNGLPW